MKTTLDLDDDLLLAAKALALRRRTTLKDMISHAIRREIGAISDPAAPEADGLERGPFGILRLKPRGKPVTDAMVRKMLDEAEEEDSRRAIKFSGKR